MNGQILPRNDLQNFATKPIGKIFFVIDSNLSIRWRTFSQSQVSYF